MYRIGTNDRKVQLFCAHVGVESLYYARSLVINSSKVLNEFLYDMPLVQANDLHSCTHLWNFSNHILYYVVVILLFSIVQQTLFCKI